MAQKTQFNKKYLKSLFESVNENILMDVITESESVSDVELLKGKKQLKDMQTLVESVILQEAILDKVKQGIASTGAAIKNNPGKVAGGLAGAGALALSGLTGYEYANNGHNLDQTTVGKAGQYVADKAGEAGQYVADKAKEVGNYVANKAGEAGDYLKNAYANAFGADQAAAQRDADIASIDVMSAENMGPEPTLDTTGAQQAATGANPANYDELTKIATDLRSQLDAGKISLEDFNTQMKGVHDAGVYYTNQAQQGLGRQVIDPLKK